MTQRTARDVADMWVRQGGPQSRVVEWVAIAMGESGLDDAAISPAGAIGLYQIMPFNAGIAGGSVGDLFSVAYNTRVAVLMSGGGTNCAAWDSAYTNISRSGRYNYLGYPERGSADWNHIPEVSVALGLDQLAQDIPQPPVDTASDLSATAAGLQQVIGRGMPQLRGDILAQQRVIGAMYQVGWRGWMYSGR